MFYRIGLDIGITSVGWCAIETQANGEPTRILDLGVRIFDAAEQPKTGASLAEPRRLARGNRRRLRRKALRLVLAKEYFAGLGVTPDAYQKDVNELRAAGLNKKLEPREFAAVLMLLLKRRGFKSNSKAQSKNEDGELLAAVKHNAGLMAAKGYRTVGEMLAAEKAVSINGKDGRTRRIYCTRNKGGDYSNTVLRSAIREEIGILFAAQARFGNPLATEQVEKDILAFFDMQRNFDDGPGKGSKYSATYSVGECAFEAGEERAPRASYSFELFTAYQKINHLRIVSAGESRALGPDEREKVVALAKKNKKTAYAAVRKVLGLSDDERFNCLTYSSKKRGDDVVKEAEKATFVTFERSRAILDCLDEEHRNAATADAVAYVLSHVKSDARRNAMFAAFPETAGLSVTEKEKLLELNCEKFGHLSIKAIGKILPYLEEGDRYDEACKKAGYNHSRTSESARLKYLRGQEIREEIDEITSPVVKRAISQTLKVLNAVIARYGSPVAVNVELAREMSKSRAERDKAMRENARRKDINDKLRDRIRDEFGCHPTYSRLLILKLYEEQCGKCPYTGETIDIGRLFDENVVQIDHIIPYSRSFNDSFDNKVLVKTAANQNKGNRTPYEWLSDGAAWDAYVNRINAMYFGNFRKRGYLLQKSFDEEEWKSRSLNDTRYICRYVRGLLEDRLMFEKAELGKKRVFAVNGAITAELRREWGMGKVREDGDLHHAVDAAVIACVTDGAIKRLSTVYKNKHEEKFGAERFGETIIAEPYRGFSDELAARCMENESAMHDRLIALGIDEDSVAEVRPIFVSRMPKRKGKGPIHKETIQSAKYIDRGISVKRVALTELKLACNADGEYYIKDYFRPEDDSKTYALLLDKLIAAGGKAEEAFAEKVFKPAAEGKTPNEIKKVKIYSKANAGVYLEKIRGYADNGAMVRVDVFSKDKKYYCVPVYTSDLYAGRLPDRAATAGKPQTEWELIDDSFKFEFALYANDLIYIKHKKGITMTKQRDNAGSRMPDAVDIREGYVYFKSFNISSACMSVITHDNCYVKESLGVKTLEYIGKCSVDVLGNVSRVKGEKRPPVAIRK